MANMYSDEIKAQVIAERKAGESWKSLSARYQTPVTTMRAWVDASIRHPKTNGLAAYDLDAMAVRLVDGSVSAIGAIYELAQDKEWLKGQNANDLAIFVGVVSDKLYRLLGAIKLGEPSRTIADAGSNSPGSTVSG